MGESDTTLTPCVKTSKAGYAIIVTASIIIMLCSGSIYAWSIFVLPLQSEFNFSNTQTQIVYGLMFSILMVAQLFVNKVQRKFGTRICAIIGALLFFSGYMVASISNGEFLVFTLGLGLISGCGMGFGYITVLCNLVKWFPRHKGLATGIAVAGFGGGAIVLSQIVRPLLANGWHVLDIFRIIGIVYGSIFLISALVLRSPAPDQPGSANIHFDISKLIKDRRFWVLGFACFSGAFSGMIFTGNLQPIGMAYGASAGAAILAISLFSIGNAAGRIVWGQLHDVMGGRKTVTISLYLLCIAMILLLGSGNSAGFLILTLILGFNYGSNFVNYASDVSEIWGVDKLDIIYPILSLAFGLSAIVGPFIGGIIRDRTGGYDAAIIIGTIVCSSCIIIYSYLMPKDHNVESTIKVNNQTKLASSKRGS